jgi:hypothetical protein
MRLVGWNILRVAVDRMMKGVLDNSIDENLVVLKGEALSR